MVAKSSLKTTLDPPLLPSKCICRSMCLLRTSKQKSGYSRCYKKDFERCLLPRFSFSIRPSLTMGVAEMLAVFAIPLGLKQ